MAIFSENYAKKIRDKKNKTYKRICWECGEDLEVVNSKQIWPGREDLTFKKFLICWKCSAWVGFKRHDVPVGYPAREHIRELRQMVLLAAKKVAAKFNSYMDFNSNVYEGFWMLSEWLHDNHKINYNDMGWLEEEDLRYLLAILDKKTMPDTPEINALFN